MRSATLQIGSRRYSMDTLDFKFEVNFCDSDELGTAAIEVTNLSENTRNGIKKDDQIIINAGYEGDIGCIFVGQLSEAAHNQGVVDWITKIKATASLDEWLGKQVNKTYHKNIEAQAILSDLLNLFGMEIGKMQLVENPTYPRGKVCKGRLKDVLTEIVTSDCKSRFLIKHGQVIISDPNQSEGQEILLSPETGLLRCSEDKVAVQADKPQNTKDGQQEKSDKENLVKLPSLLRYEIGPGAAVTVKSKAHNGRFLIKKGQHVGSRTGKWETMMEGMPL